MTNISPVCQFSSHSHKTPRTKSPSLGEIERIEKMSPLELGIRAVESQMGQQKRRNSHSSKADGGVSQRVEERSQTAFELCENKCSTKIKAEVEKEIDSDNEQRHETLTYDISNSVEEDGAPETLTLSDGKAEATQHTKTLLKISKLKKDEQKEKRRIQEAKYKQNKLQSQSRKAAILQKNENHQEPVANNVSSSEDELDLITSAKKSPSSSKASLPYRLPDSVLAAADTYEKQDPKEFKNTHKRFDIQDSDEITMPKNQKPTKSNTKRVKVGPVQVCVLQQLSDKVAPKAESRSPKDIAMSKTKKFRRKVSVPKGLAKN